jgi:CheY-like chemotaxis protein
MKILWLDDEPRRVASFQEALALQGHEVSLVESVDDLENRLRTEQGWQVVLLDVMLPTGKYDVEDANAGLDTGLLIARKLSDELPNLSVILLTNRADVDWLMEKSGARVLRKSEISPWELGPLLSGDPTSDL